jgi:hypothetical protein
LVADIPSETEEALLVVFLAVLKQLVITIEALLTEAALGMALESGGLGRVLVGLSRIAILEMLHKLRGRH